MSFRVEQIDHVELFVPDRSEAAAWYAEVLGLDPLPGAEKWAALPGGPLMISPDGGRTKLALFEGEPQGTRPTAGFHRVAFRVNGPDFLAFLGRIEQLGLGKGGRTVQVMDHETAFSAYFADPYGHRLELTTYDHEVVRAARREPAGGPRPGSPRAVA
jgi:catechol 2,3-dioxygenase-like lactoylglutathione lyase family enzyme